MPIYEYVCRDCGHELERLQRLADDPLTECPDCGEAALKRKISAAGFRLAGGGWYETDFKSEGQRNLSGDKNEGAKSSETDGGAKKNDDSGATAKPSESTGKAASDKGTGKTDTAKPARESGAKSGQKSASGDGG